MARKIAYIPNVSNDSSRPSAMTLEDIPADVREDIEEAYKALKSNPNGRLRAAFDTKAEMLAFQTMAVAYCGLRPAELGGPIVFRKSPTKGLGEAVMDFRVKDAPTENTATVEGIREAAAAAGGTPVKAVPAKAPAKARKAA